MGFGKHAHAHVHCMRTCIRMCKLRRSDVQSLTTAPRASTPPLPRLSRTRTRTCSGLDHGALLRAYRSGCDVHAGAGEL
jgi:hypothetical protein